jgi:uncharacterized protein (DUF305 family)
MEPMTDKKYARDMVVHHRMAVKMSQELLRGSPRPKIKAFAEKVISAQSEEIKWLQSWIEGNP